MSPAGFGLKALVGFTLAFAKGCDFRSVAASGGAAEQASMGLVSVHEPEHAAPARAALERTRNAVTCVTDYG